MSRAAPCVSRRPAPPICDSWANSGKPPSAVNMLLALDTATDTIGLALTDGARILAEEVWLARPHATAGRSRCWRCCAPVVGDGRLHGTNGENAVGKRKAKSSFSKAGTWRPCWNARPTWAGRSNQIG